MIAALERTFHDDASWNRPAGRVLHLARARRRPRRLRARGPRRRERRRHRAGPGLLPSRVGAGSSSARLAFSYETPERIAEGVERLGSAALDAYERLSQRRARERSNRNPPAKPIATQRMMRGSRRVDVEKKRKSTLTFSLFLSAMHDGVEREHAEDDQRPRSVAPLRRRGRVGPFHEENPTRRDRRRRAEADAARAGAASAARERRLAPRGRSGTADSREERRDSRVGSNSRRRWLVSVSSSFPKAAPQRPARILSSGSGSDKPRCGQIPRNLRLFSEQ